MQNTNRRNLYLITLCVSVAFMALGVSSTWPTPVLPKFKNNETKVEINQNEVAVMLSIYPVGFAAGSFTTRFVADTLGRRVTILGSAIPIAIGSLIVVFATKAWLLYVTGFMWQYGTGMVSTVIGYYMSEIADKDIRATLQTITSFMFKFGTLITMILGPFLEYDTLNYIMITLPVCFFIVCLWIPETPHFCLKTGNVEAARKSLKKLRRYKNDADLEEELQALKSSVKEEMTRSSTVKELLSGPQYRKAIIIGLGLKVTHIMTGGALIKQYLGLIMEETKIKLELSFVLIIYGCVTFVVGMISSILVDRMGRRPLLIYSYIGTGLSLAAVATYFFLQDIVQISAETLTTFGFVPLTGIILSNVVSTLGFNSLIYIIPAEIFPMNVKAIAITSLNIVGCILAVITARGYQFVKDSCGLTTIFTIFTVVSIGGGIFSYYIVTETRGKDLREIQQELQGQYYGVVALDNKEVVEDQKEDEVELKELKISDTQES